MTPAWKMLGDKIAADHFPKIFFNFREVREITGYGENTIARRCLEAGILVKKDGRSKRIDAYDIGALLCDGRVSPVEND